MAVVAAVFQLVGASTGAFDDGQAYVHGKDAHDKAYVHGKDVRGEDAAKYWFTEMSRRRKNWAINMYLQIKLKG